MHHVSKDEIMLHFKSEQNVKLSKSWTSTYKFGPRYLLNLSTNFTLEHFVNKICNCLHARLLDKKLQLVPCVKYIFTEVLQGKFVFWSIFTINKNWGKIDTPFSAQFENYVFRPGSLTFIINNERNGLETLANLEFC